MSPWWTAVLLAVAAQAPVVVIDREIEIGAGDWNYVEARVVRPATTVHCQFEAAGLAKVRALLIPASALESKRSGRPHLELASTSYAQSGLLRHSLGAAGEYAVLVENLEGREPTRVHLKVWLESERTAWQLPWYRRLAVLGLSFAGFAVAVFYSWSKLRAHIHR
jgi:hypothetical protein